jgi:cell division protein FtsW
METTEHQSTLYTFVTIIMICVTIGMIFIYSSSSVYALERLGCADYYLRKQVAGLALGMIGLFVVRYLPLSFIKQCVPWAFFATVLLTIMTLIPGFGQSIHGSQRWIYIAGFGFQPSEALKMAYIVYLGWLLSKKQYRLSSLSQGYFPLLTVLGATGLLLLKQPDFGQAVTLCVTSFFLFYIAGCRLKHLLWTWSSLLPVIGLLIYMKPYRVQRVLTFLNPWADPQGAGFQIIQSLIAIGSGNITGVGIAQSKQKFFYLPMQHTDFIFSIIAEETGFIGGCVLICLFVLFLYTGLRLASRLRDPFAYYTTVGYVLLTSLQAVINLFVATGLLPTKGLGLPFISYGNSALLCNLVMLGLIINFVYANEEEFPISDVAPSMQPRF